MTFLNFFCLSVSPGVLGAVAVINKHLNSEPLNISVVGEDKTHDTMYTDGYVKLYLAREVKDNSGGLLDYRDRPPWIKKQ